LEEKEGKEGKRPVRGEGLGGRGLADAGGCAGSTGKSKRFIFLKRERERDGRRGSFLPIRETHDDLQA
jgi:hypothetical protein